MVHLKTGDRSPDVTNMKHQHAFVIVGDRTFFGVHMTQYHCEVHKYQLIVRFSIPDEAAEALRELRRKNPEDTFVLCNADDDEMTIPALGSQRVRSFKGNIFYGMPPLPEVMPEHYFPWNLDVCRPAIANVPVTLERIVTYRPFAHSLPQPEFALYLLFGSGGEAHMTNLQTARLDSGQFEAPRYGWDYDHVMSLKGAPEWLDEELLEAGIPVGLPAIRMHARADPSEPCFGDAPPFVPGDKVDVLYRGVAPARHVVADPTFLWATAVCNSESILDSHPELLTLTITPMPKKYLR